MTYKAPIDTVLSVGGLNLTGMGMLLSIAEEPLAAGVEEVDLVGTPYIYSVKNGKMSYGFSVDGYVREASKSVLDLSNAGETAGEPHSVIYARYGDNPGAQADLIPRVHARGGTFDLPKDGLIKVTGLAYELAEGAGVLKDGTLIANATGLAASPSPYMDLRHDFGAAHAGPWTLIVHASNIEFGGGMRLGVRLYTTAVADGASGWAAVGAAAAHRFNIAGGTRQDSVENGMANLSRWVGLSMTWTGGANRSADIVAGLRRA